MVNSANTECLLCGALARGHFVPIAELHLSEIARPLSVAKRALASRMPEGRFPAKSGHS
jgi:hypothetical protein